MPVANRKYLCSSAGVVGPCYMLDIEQVDSLDDTERGDGGFGSTGVN